MINNFEVAVHCATTIMYSSTQKPSEDMRHTLMPCSVLAYVGGEEDIEFWSMDPTPELDGASAYKMAVPVVPGYVQQVILQMLRTVHHVPFHLQASESVAEFFEVRPDCLCLVDTEEYKTQLVHESVHVLKHDDKFCLVRFELSTSGGVTVIEATGERTNLPIFSTEIPGVGSLVGRVRAYLRHVLPTQR